MNIIKWGLLGMTGLALFVCEEINAAEMPNTSADEVSVPMVTAQPEIFLQTQKCIRQKEDREGCYQMDLYTLKTNIDWIDPYFQKAARSLLKFDSYTLSNREIKEKQAQWDKLPVDKLKKEFIANVERLFDNDDVMPVGYSLEYKPRFLAQNNQLAMFVTYYYAFTGGAHGIYGTSFYNFDLKTKKLLDLDDILLPGKKREFAELLREAYLEYISVVESEPDQAKAEQRLLEREDRGWIAEPTDNFAFVYNGLLLDYLPYMLGSFAEGEIQLLIPYSRLTDIVKPEYLFNTTKTIISE